MQELRSSFADPSLLAELQPEKLGAKILFIFRARLGENAGQNSFNLNNERLGLWPHYTMNHEPWARTPGPIREAVELAITGAWAWLRAQGLLIPAPGAGGDWEVLSRRARAFETHDDFASFATARLLPREVLHPHLAKRVWLAFMRGDFDSAVFYAMKTVEVRVREASGLGNDLVGVALMRKAFDLKLVR